MKFSFFNILNSLFNIHYFFLVLAYSGYDLAGDYFTISNNSTSKVKTVAGGIVSPRPISP